MKKTAGILILLTIILGFIAYPTINNNLWSVASIKGSQGISSTNELITTLPASHPHARLLQARAAMSEQDYPQALQLIEPLVPTTDPVILQTYAELLFSLECYTEALEIWHGLGMYNKIEHAASALRDMNNIEMNILANQKAYDIRPDIYASSLLNALLTRANQLRDEGRVAASIPLYKAIIERFSDSEGPLSDLAWAYLLLDEKELAVIILDKAMLIPSSNFQFYMRAGSLYEQFGIFDRSLEAYQKALYICGNCQDATRAINRVTTP